MQRSVPFKYVSALAALLAILLLSGCATAPQEAAVPGQQNVSEAEPSETGVPPLDLSGELLKQLLVAELAYFRNDVLTSLEILEKLAFETRDVRIAEVVSLRAISQRQFDVASNTSDLWVQLRPDSASAWYANAVSQVATQKFAQAVEGFQNTLKLSTEAEETTVQNIVRTLSSNLEPKFAFGLFERIIEPFPDSIPGRLQLINLAVASEQSASLVDGLIAEGLEMQPGSGEFAAVSFALDLRRGKIEDAVAFAVAYLERYPDSVELRHSYARYLVEEGYYQEAVEQYEIISDPEAVYMQATLHEQANYPDLSRQKFLEFYELEPNNQAVLVNLAELALQSKDYDEASNWISQITSRNFSFSRFLLTADYVAGTRNVEQAVALLDEYPVESDQQKIRIYLSIDRLYRESGQLEKALSRINGGLDQFPGNTTLLIAKSYTAAELNLIDQVEDAAKAVLAKQPENALALNALGYTLVDQTDRVEEGTGYLEKALEQEPNDPYILDSMGWAQFKLGNYELAIELLETALSRRDDPVMAAHLGEVYWVQGREQKATQIWSRAQKKTPDSEILLETIERLTGQ